MPIDEKLLDLLELWQRRRDEGGDVDIDALAGGDAELAARLRAAIAELGKTRWVQEEVKTSVKLDVPQPRSKLGPYQILEMLGQGGMGAVFKARHTRLNKYVAIKVMPEHLMRSVEAVARFDREMKAIGVLEHPNIVRATDAGEDHGTHYLVMEYVDGQDLQRFVKERGPLAVPEACRLIRDAAVALAHAHQIGLVHRDIKPSNLLITKSGQLKVLDLGLARLLQDAEGDSGLTNSGASLGTPDYMAPEQWSDSRSVDQRVDLYALGCTLYFLLTGRPPYGSPQYRSVIEKMAGHAQGLIPSLSEARAEVPRDLDKLYQQLMAKRAADRLGSAEELARRLEPFSIAAVPPLGEGKTPAAASASATAAKKTGSPSRKRWALGALVALAACVVCVVTAAGIKNWQQASRRVSSATNRAAAASQSQHEPTTLASSAGLPSPDRSVVEWALKAGGKVQLSPAKEGDQPVLVKTVAELPRTPFKIYSLRFPENCLIADADLDHLAPITSLDELFFNSSTITSQGLEKLARVPGLSHLKSISIRSTQLDDAAVAQITSFHELTEVGIFGPFTDSSLGALPKLPHLRNLYLHGNISDAGLGALRDLHLGVISIKDQTEITDEGIKALGLERMRQLQMILLGETATGDEALMRAAQLPDLYSLQCGNNTSDLGLKQLENCDQLTTLECGGSKITDLGAQSLGKLKGLKALTLHDTRMTDAGLTALAACEQLKELTIKGSPSVTADGMAKLHAALPQCKIVTDFDQSKAQPGPSK